MLPPPAPAMESGETSDRLEVSLIVYIPLILATWPHNSDAILALASSRVRSVCNSERHASELSQHGSQRGNRLCGDNRDAAALPRQSKGFFIARWVARPQASLSPSHRVTYGPGAGPDYSLPSKFGPLGC